MSRGHVRRRGEGSFELKYEAGTDPRTGKRITKYASFRGTKREAQAKLTELLDAVAKGTHVDRSAVSVAEFVRSRIDQWEASNKISAKTAARYRELNAYQITRHIGHKALQKLRRLDIEEWHTVLRNSGRADGKGGIAPRTIAHAHHLLATALKDAKKDRLVLDIVTADEKAPTVRDEEVLIVPDVPGFVEKLKTSAGRLYVPAMVSLFTGMRRNEVLALKWGRVDLDRNIIEVRESLEHTKTYGIRFKPPKSKAGRRKITLPDILIDVLREYRKSQLELRMKLGAGKLQDDDLLFCRLEGGPLSPAAISTAWGEYATRIGMPGTRFHALRHTHASQLIDAGVDVVTISKRLGHAKPDVTLRTYAHLFRKDDSKAAAAINAAMR